MVHTIWGSTRKPVAAEQLAKFFATQTAIEGTLYIGYPIIGTPEGPFRIDAILLGPKAGLVVFHVIEGKEAGNFAQAQDESFTKLQAKLLQHKALIKGRVLQIVPQCVTFAPAINNTSALTTAEHPICNLKTLEAFLQTLDFEEDNYYKAAVAAIQSISTIKKGKKKRETKDPESRGSKLKELEDSIANLDNIQSAAVIETFDGVQRIRGLAGSGKTIVLALKVAYLHAQNQDWKLAVTFHTRSLKGQFESLINTFVIEQTNEEPDWDNIHVINAWGSPGEDRQGIYYSFCKDHGIEYMDYKSARSSFGTGKEFEGACEKALQEIKQYKPAYDAILIDEAQDFSPNFLLLCYEYLRSPKRLVYAYDELQSLTNKSLPPPEEIFGKNPDGQPRVAFSPAQAGKPRQDIILEKCYRNSRPILTSAHALGFGIYRKPEGLIQMFDHKELWMDIGYNVVHGKLEEGKQVALSRSGETSPEFLEAHSPVEDLIKFEVFKTDEEQTDWLVNQIQKNLEKDELQPSDIIIINPDPITTRNAVGKARRKLLEKGINSNLAGVSTSPDIFFESDNVTFTGVFRAKGNEAAMVYVINAQDCYTAWRGDLARVRNRLFTAITRSKAWVRVLGYGEDMDQLKAEFERIVAADFRLNFKYPTTEERAHMRVINRDMSAEDKKRIRQKQLSLEDILESLESGETVLEDYPDDVIKKFRTLLSQAEK